MLTLMMNAFDIFSDAETNVVRTAFGIEGELFQLSEIAGLCRMFVIWGAAIACIGISMMMMFQHTNPKMLAELKQDLIQKLKVVWLASSAVTIFNLLKAFFDSIFGLR